MLQEKGLTLNQAKSHFACEKLKYFGIVINHEDVRTDDSKVKSITEVKTQKNAREGLLGSINGESNFGPRITEKADKWQNLSSRTIRRALLLVEFNVEWEHRPETQNVVAYLLSRNPVENL
ncbi:hypothetical protein TNCV_129961 [Trichonephila clavipes]|nr:hypothetical protein TNCV_129961 [Trichonephila clavipes]